jgi:hypothetical protein
MEVSLQDKKLAIIDAAIAVAKGELQIRACNYELEVRKLIKTIPPTALQPPSDVLTSLKIDRTVIRFAIQISREKLSIPCRRLYTIHELRKSLSKHLLETNITAVELESEYGVPVRTLREYENEVVDLWREIRDDPGLNKEDVKRLQSVDEIAIVQTIIDGIEFHQPGKRPIIDSLHITILAKRMNEMNLCGVGLDMKGMSAFVRKYVQDVAQLKELQDNSWNNGIVQQDKGYADQTSCFLRNFKACPTFIRNRFFGTVDSDKTTGAATSVGTMTKASPLSLKRAAAASPTLNALMIKKFLEHNQILIGKGLFSALGPLARNNINLDEIGIDPHGKISMLYSLNRGRRERRFTLQSGEHAPFWVSVIIAACANGDLLFPVIIHQGGSFEDMPGNFALRLNENYHVTSTPSGYSDKETFIVIASVIRDYLIERGDDNEHNIVYVDGHDSHFNGNVFQFFSEVNISCRFLKSNDSVNDQPLDNGVNSLISKAYNEKYNDWRVRNMAETITPAIFNDIFSKAFESVRTAETTRKVIIESFRKTGIFPLRDIYTEEVPPPSSTSCVTVGEERVKLARIKLAEPFIYDEKDQQIVKRMKIDTQVAVHNTSSSSPPSALSLPSAEIQIIHPSNIANSVDLSATNGEVLFGHTEASSISLSSSSSSSSFSSCGNDIAAHGVQFGITYPLSK